MAKNIAARRAAKAQRGKSVVAQKRKAEISANSTAGQVRVAAAMPIQHCLISGGLFEMGMGTLVLARGTTPYYLTTAVFLLDTLALGVKDVFLRHLDDREFASYTDSMSALTPMEPVDPAYARKLLHGLTGWSRGHGLLPHRHYEEIERLFGSTGPGGSDAVFEFGKDGKPLIVARLSDADNDWLDAYEEDEDDGSDDLIIDDEAETSTDVERGVQASAATQD